MPTNLLHRLLVTVVVAAIAWLTTAGTANATTSAGAQSDTSSAVETTPDAGATSTTAASEPEGGATTSTIVRTQALEEDRFHPRDVIDWIKDNLAVVIGGVGVVLVVLTWKWVSRPPNAKF